MAGIKDRLASFACCLHFVHLIHSPLISFWPLDPILAIFYVHFGEIFIGSLISIEIPPSYLTMAAKPVDPGFASFRPRVDRSTFFVRNPTLSEICVADN